MTNFIRAANPIWWIPDLTGFPLNDEYYAFFKQNDEPHDFQAVYMDVNGNDPWPDPLQFEPAGTLPNNLYFNELLTYRIEIRHGNGSMDQLIYLIENFVPGTSSSIDTTALSTSDNMITNPTFSDVNFVAPPGSANKTFTYAQPSTGNYSVPIGAGWRLELEGSGSITVTQIATQGNDNLFGDPNYYLRINAISGWTSVKLVQRLNNNGAIFANGAIAIAFTAAAAGSGFQGQVQYTPSTGTSINIFDQPIAVGALSEYKFARDLPASDNSDADGSAYVDIEFVIPIGSDLSITNVQITGQSINLPDTFNENTDPPSYRQQTYERTVDQEFNAYKSWLFNKRIPSSLVAWDFPLNPAQFAIPGGAPYNTPRAYPPQAVGANKSYYAWDQTILFQSVDSAIGVTSPASGDLTLTAAATTQMAVIQYLPTTQARELLAGRIAVNIAANSTTASSNGVVCTCSLWYTTDANLPNILPTGGTPPNSSSLVATLDANGKPNTFNGTNWFEVPRIIQQDAIFTVLSEPGNAKYNDYNFNDWDLQSDSSINSATYFAIVMGTAEITANDALHILSVGLMPGEIATRPAPQTKDQVLRESQYYYEKSYADGIYPSNNGVPTNTTVGLIVVTAPLYADLVGGTNDLVVKTFSLPYKEVKVSKTPGITLLTDAGLVDNIVIAINQGAAGDAGFKANRPIAGNYSPTVSDNYATYKVGASVSPALTRPNNVFNEGLIYFHYLIDSKLGTF